MKSIQRIIALIKMPGIIILLLLATTQSYSAGLKKLILLDFKNVEKNPDYNYLEASITDATIKILKKKIRFH